jgi:hypothetical protein
LGPRRLEFPPEALALLKDKNLDHGLHGLSQQDMIPILKVGNGKFTVRIIEPAEMKYERKIVLILSVTSV